VEITEVRIKLMEEAGERLQAFARSPLTIVSSSAT
jgi:hypothetical protein